MRFAHILLFTCIAWPNVNVLAEESSDKIVSKSEFSVTPYFPYGRKQVAVGAAPEKYKVELGDTLFDICDQLLDDPDYWPKLWALNPDIKNPHFIYPNMTLSFYPGSEDAPPYLDVVSESDIVPIDMDLVRTEELVSENPDTLEELQNEPMLTAAEIVQQQPVNRDIPIEIESEFESIGAVYVPDQTKIIIPAFFFEEEPEPLGRVVAGPKGEMLLQPDHRVIVESDGAVAPGSTYTVMRPSGEVYNGNGDSVGYRYEFIAHITGEQVLEDEAYQMAFIKNSRLGVRPDDLVMPYRATTRTYNQTTLGSFTENHEISIVGFELPLQSMGGQGQLVFVEGAFSSGSSFPVYQRVDRRTLTMFSLSVPEVKSRVGVIKIIDTVGSASIGIVLKNTLDIRVGDLLGKG